MGILKPEAEFDLMEYVGGLLSPDKTLEEITFRHPYTFEELRVLKVDTRSVILKNGPLVDRKKLVTLAFMMADQQLGLYTRALDTALYLGGNTEESE